MIRDGIRRAFNLALRRGDRWQRDVEDEIKLHLLLRAEQLMERGASPDRAYAEAARRFGPLKESRARLLEAARHRERQMQRTEFLSDFRQDVSFAFRTLRRQKGWTAITIVTLALGIGATTAVFSVVSSLLLHAIPYPNADRIVVVSQQPSQGNNTGIQVTITPSSDVVKVWLAGSRSFEVLEPYHASGVRLTTTADPAPVRATAILPSFLTFAGERPLIGRMFTQSEIASKAPVALMAEGLWRERYGASKDIIGRPVVLNDSSYTVVGILPARLQTPGLGRDRTDFWLPLDLRNKDLGLSLVGRLRRGTDIPAATRELDTLTARANLYSAGKLPFLAVMRRPAELIGFRQALIMLTGAVALVLLVACANVAHLLMARAATRQRELAVRAALGAGRARLLRQLLAESLVLAFAGAVSGVLLGWVGLKVMVGLRPQRLSELAVAHLDLTTLAVTTAVAIGSGVLFGIIGAFQTSKHSTHDSLKAGSLATSHARSHNRLRSLLIVSEMALSAMLIIGATLLVRTVINLQHTDLGFEPKGLYAAAVSLPKTRYTTDASRQEFFDKLTARLRATRGVDGLALANIPPGARGFAVGTFEVEGDAASAAAGSSFTDVNTVDNAYFKTMGIRLLEGSLFTDTTRAAGQVIVNAAFAHKRWGPGGALGKRVRIAYQGQGTWKTIVGVAADASTMGPAAISSAPFLYSPLSTPNLQTTILIRASRADDLAGTVRTISKTIDPLLAVPQVEGIERVVAASIAGPRFTMLLLTVFTILALVLAAVGLYGVMAYSVAQRTREIGIRMALGATQGVIARSVIVRGVMLAVVGALLGLGGAYWGTRLIETMLYQVNALDAASFATGAAVLLITAILACVVPTRRALGVDPIRAIRAD